MALFIRPQIPTCMLISFSPADLKSCSPNLSMTPQNRNTEKYTARERGSIVRVFLRTSFTGDPLPGQPLWCRPVRNVHIFVVSVFDDACGQVANDRRVCLYLRGRLTRHPRQISTSGTLRMITSTYSDNNLLVGCMSVRI